MDLALNGKRVLITGASSGLGFTTAMAFGQEGCRLGLIGRSQQKLRELCDRLGGTRSGHNYLSCDLMQPGGPRQALETLEDGQDEFDVVVHCIGGPLDVASPLATIEEWTNVWRFNVGIAIEINSFLAPKMQRKGWGRIVHVSSASGKRIRGKLPYAVCKSFLIPYTEGLGRALAKDGVIVSAVLPGAYAYDGSYWDKVKDSNPSKLAYFLHHQQAIGRMGSREEVAAFIVFLASPLASFAAGAVIAVDGGAGGVL